MTDALHAAVEQIRARCGPAPIDALALSLSCEFLARAAAETPERFRSLALVSPTDVFQTGALPYFEVPEDFCRAYDLFSGSAGSADTGRR